MSILPETPPPISDPKAPPALPATKGNAPGDGPTSQKRGILVAGPRELPAYGTVRIWVDAGSGGTGERADVAVDRLRLAEIDSGEGATALYRLATSHHQG
ncbi:hypothetical protein O7632_27400 [Solwaraspora sp. WMMD406]|uniref:hypothetical protein n=1 Tax=Solwaraspora sp. WMMD406 TaxID=3016095 RepID=UPI00241748E4|nr:hypothetical protein [Solwaraspora sp. WMMD406]MDG4767791.1 hypothetical protein [Solwaraspora sp. WMMD406]